MKRIAKKVLLVGWDAADWKFLTPYMDEGLMPTLTKLIEGGVKGRLATLDPPLSPTLWTSIATGKRPYQHGIHGFTEADPSGNSIRPIYITNRKVKAIWNILTQHGLRSNVVGWWPSHPAEPINGVMVSNFYQRAKSGTTNQSWPMLKGTVYPDALSETLQKLRIHPTELTGTILQQFVPDAHKVDQSTDRKLRSIANTTAECSSIHSAATYIMEHSEWDFMAVYFDAIDHYCHGFMKYHPPYREQINRKDYELYKDVVKSGCRYHDMMLARLLEIAGDDTTVILISDHGFHPDNNRPTSIPQEPAGPAVEHSPYGIIVMNGPGIKKDELIFGASLLDITPTLLTLFGLPIAEDMDGKVLIQTFEETPEIDTIRSWENIKGQDGSHTDDVEQSEEEMEAELKQLIDLGYIEDPGADRAGAVLKTQNENNYYLARSYIDGGKWEEGVALLKALHEANPEVLRYATHLIHGCQVMGKMKDARQVVDQVRSVFKSESSQLDILEATLLLSEERPAKALELFQKVEREAGDVPRMNLRIGNAYLQLRKFQAAEAALLKELAVNPEESQAIYLLGVTYYETMRYEEALEQFLTSIGMMYYFPPAHFYLGEALIALERYEDAVNAYDVCLRLAPGMNRARQRIISVYEQFLKQPGKAFKYKTDFQNKIEGEVIIVSGLPRSGTSMMMQMLEAGGITIFTDKERGADQNNPKGYYEHEAVKNLHKNKKWLPEANGQAVKVIAQLLYHLPMNFRYKVIFMERNLYEVVQSQQKMLERNAVASADTTTFPTSLLDSYKNTLEQVKEWAVRQPNVEIINIAHEDVIEQPFSAALQVHDFLSGITRPEKMAGVVDQKLYRERMKK